MTDWNDLSDEMKEIHHIVTNRNLYKDYDELEKLEEKIRADERAKAVNKFLDELCENLEEYQTASNMVSIDDVYHVSKEISEKLAGKKSLKADYLTLIQKILTQRDMLEALAEECSELSQAALKLIRGSCITNNTTPKSYSECKENLIEEICDVLTCLEVLGIKIPNTDNYFKWER